MPEDDGGEAIKGYKIERRDVEKSSWVAVGKTKADTLTLKAMKLIEGHNYFFRVTAENKIGVSDPCETADPITAKLPFGA